MKKKIITYLLFLFSISIASQSYTVDIKNLTLRVDGDEGICQSWVKMTANFIDGSVSQFLFYDFGGGEGIKTMPNTVIQVPGIIKSLYVQTYTNERRDGLFKNPCGGTEIYPDGNINNIDAKCKVGHYNHYGRNGGDFEAENEIDFDYKIYPNINLVDPTDDIIGFDDNFNVSVDNNSSKGFDSSVYQWEYQVVGTGESIDVRNWSSMPSATTFGEESFEILPSSFLNNDEIGKKLYLRVNPCGLNEAYYRNSFFTGGEWRERIKLKSILYNLKPSAPHINIQDKTNSKCSKKNNGNARLYLDRAVKDNEIFSLDIVLDGGQPKNKNNLTKDDFDANNSFLLDNLSPGVYSVSILNPNYYTGSPTHKATFTINEPTPVEFSITNTVNVWCNGGSDGEITITANGGQLFQPYEYLLREVGDTTENWIVFTNTPTFPNSEVTERITGLLPKKYELKVKDANGCVAKEIRLDNSGQIVGLGAEIKEEIEITEPSPPVAVVFVDHKEPTAFDFSDGRITAKINGGTKITPDNTYNFVWKYYDTATATWIDWTDFTYDYDTSTEDWFIILQNAKAGNYKLTVTDANYTNATNKEGCTISKAEFTLKEPPLLKLSLAKTKTISCHNTNTFGDPSSDGELKATAEGGVPFDPNTNRGYKYKYIWKKRDALGVYQLIPGETSDVLSNINAGEYAVNIIDANDITVGTATNNVITPVDVTKALTQPDLLQITLTKVDVFCNQGNDGSIDATITGGTPFDDGSYTIRWSTNQTTEDLDTLIAGTYTIDVTDQKGCQAQATITIDEPTDPLEINYTFFEPTFAGATNGWIKATITGGTPLDSGAYTYLWKDATNGTNLNTQVTETINATSYIIKLNDLGAGIYNLAIEDKNHPLAINKDNCTITNSEQPLSDPEPLTADIQVHTPISCNSTNTYGDPSSDGALEVIAEGGVKLQPTDNNGLPYYYTWKKETNPNVWTTLTTQTTNIATNLDVGKYAVNVEDANGIILGVYQNNVLVNAIDSTYTFKEPPLLKLSIEKQDVYCFNGSDSWAKAIITGGTLPYSIQWSNGDTTVQTSDLSQGTYTVSITDGRGCQVEGSIEINQPNTPLAINYTAFATPSTGGASDGWIEAQITGGTNFTDGSYTYYWQDDTGTLLNAQTSTNNVGGIFQIRLNTIPKGNYYLTIEDANFPLATTGDGCTIIDNEFILYDPIEAIISIETPISCHQNNVFNNPYSDGALQVTVTGGLPFTTGQPYMYYWKKENSSGGFDDLNQNTPIAMGLSDGNYTLNVEDSRGVIIGVYESLNLINATDATFNFVEPDLLQVSLTATEISCGAGNDGTATVAITGGIPPYHIQWLNGQDQETATNLIAGNHLVYVTDARGCKVTGNITIDQPGGLNIEVVTQTNPTCFQGNDGQIELQLSGGAPPYTYAWRSGATTTSIHNLTQGTYTFSLTDANGCTTFKEIRLEHPEEITIDLGEDKTLCTAQTYDLNGSISDVNATYAWVSDTGFTANTAQITVSQAGTYRITATSSLGCTATDTIIISTAATAIDSEFLVSSQAYVNEDVVLINVSDPLGETSKWIIPTGVTVINEAQTTITVRFPELGAYQVGLISTQGACSQEIYKNIVVEQNSGLPSAGDAETPFIGEFMISPNPNNGQFEVHIQLAESSPIALRIFDGLGNFVFSQPTLPTTEEYTIPINLSLAAGTYLVVLETAQETQIKRLIAF